jgi:hypothetical protein
MDTKQIVDTLKSIFKEKKKRIIFWYDAEKEFEDMLSSIQLDDVTILRLEEFGTRKPSGCTGFAENTYH